jgi:phosphoglycolate phosphatase
MKYKAVLFDMDGTLLDTLQDLTDSVNELLENHCYPARSMDCVRESVGNGARALLKKTLPENVRENELETLIQEYFGIYQKNMNNHTRPFPGVMDVLQYLRQNNVRTAIISNKPDPAVVTLSKNLFGSLIDYTMGEREGIPRKPDPAGAHMALERLDVAASGAMYVGDLAVDIKTAKNAGVRSVGVTWGFRGADELAAAGADHIISDIRELIALTGGKAT